MKPIQYSRPSRRHGRLFVLALLLATLLATLSCTGGESGGRVLVLGIDGLDPQALDLLMAEGKMPNFARLRQHGAYGRLISQKPLLSPIIWTTIATGKGAEDHGIGHFVAVSETGEQLPATSEMRRVKALWNIVSEADQEVMSVGWWATWPPEPVSGAIVSDHTSYHFLFEDGFTADGEDDGAGKTHPPELYGRIQPHLRRPQDVGADELARFVDVEAGDLAGDFDFKDDLSHFRWALATALSYRDIGLELWLDESPDLGLVYIEGVDSTSHLFGHLFRAEGLGGELAEQQQRYGRAVEEMYLFADRLVGDYLAAIGPDTTLMVLSDHGFELGVLHDDPSKTRDLRRVSERFHRLEGVLYVYGRGVKAGARIDRPSILDITPTVLSLLGLEPAADMPGRVLADAFSIELGDTRRASYEDGAAGGARVATRDARTDAALKEHLESLGYLGGGSDGAGASSPQGDRNLAAIEFEAGNYREAARAFKRLVDENPDDASLRTSLAGALGALGRYDEARVELDRAIELSPLNVEAYHNRAVLHERAGDTDAAVADYRTALRYLPQYEPSRRALVRLTGSAEVRVPTDADQARAAALADEASLEARKGNYSRAMELLDEAEAVAPEYILTYQYRSNVAYLMGDLDTAIAAIERGLELEPDNALFQSNLERLRADAGGR